jgi:VWFA-related protein
MAIRRILIILCILSSASSLFCAEEKREQSAAFMGGARKREAADPARFKISVNSNLVLTDVAVVGKNLPRLRAEDFLIYDNKVSQDIALFSYDQMPIAVVLLIDHSSSVVPIFPLLQLSSLLALKDLRSDDQVALFKFSDGCSKVVELTTDRLAIGREITQIKAGGGTYVFGALRKAAEYLRKNARELRHAIVMVSDNCSRGEEYDVQDTIDEVLESSVSLYSIQIGRLDCGNSDENVRRIVKKSGGEHYVLGNETSLQSALKDVMANLRYRYTIGFYPSSTGEEGSYHELDVKLLRKERFPECQLITRKGYYAGGSADPSDGSDKPPAASTSRNDSDQILIQRAMLTAATIGMNIPDIPLTVTTAEKTAAHSSPQLEVNLILNADGIGFRATNGGFASNQEIAVFYADRKGRILGYDWKTLKNLFNPEQYSMAVKEGIAYSTTIPADKDNKILNIVVYDEVRNQIGSKIVKLP